MSYYQFQNSVARSFYFVATCFFKMLLFVNVPYFKKYSYKTPHTKPEPDIPPPILKKSKNKLLWSQIIALRQKNGIIVKPIKHRVNVLKSFHCPDCYAPIDYVYANGYSYLCSLCGRQVQKNTTKIRTQKYLSLFCPFCNQPLVWKKERSFFIVYKCVNHQCQHKLKFSTRYTWRLFIVSDKLPLQNTPESVKLSRSHSPIYIIASALFFSVNIAIASTNISSILSTLFSIKISHKTIDNWKYASASLLYKFFFSTKISLPNTIVIDETYISVLGITHYLYSALSPDRREVIAFFLSKKRNGNAAFNLLHLISARCIDKSLNCRIVTDGAPFYPPAIYCANLVLGTKFSHDVIVGLKGKHPRRMFKNMIEKFWSTFHFSYKSHHGLKDYEASIAHATLFFSYYNFFKPHLALNGETPLSIKNISPDENSIQKWIKLLSLADNQLNSS
jgi:transposase-like protein